MKDKVYLAGPIEDLSIKDMKTWRARATRMLEDRGIETLDPTRRITFHDQIEGCIQDTTKSQNICNRVFKLDLQDIADSSVILADVRRSSGRGTGTSMELMFAHTKNKIIILLAHEDDFTHPFYEAIATEKHYNLVDAITAVTEYYV